MRFRNDDPQRVATLIKFKATPNHIFGRHFHLLRPIYDAYMNRKVRDDSNSPLKPSPRPTVIARSMVDRDVTLGILQRRPPRGAFFFLAFVSFGLYSPMYIRRLRHGLLQPDRKLHCFP